MTDKSPGKPADKAADETARAPRAGRGAKVRPYHHGGLPEALLQAAETVLKRDGLRGLTLRSIAREAGVSHTAPQHHFGDTAGVLSELVADGHRRLAAAMSARASEATPGPARRKAVAHAYIDFAVANPDMFRLMSRNELLDLERTSLQDARRNSMRLLSGVLDPAPVVDAQGNNEWWGELDAERAVTMAAGWAYVHGLAALLVDQRFAGLVRRTPSIEDAKALVYRAIEDMAIAPER
ncbi:TetR family transcriptional regulator [Pandoraea iniqua]|uniref:TetR/AcrR family transcriptional regulator n=1 Tax=Pandoraea iniqua TaxID=2508288 RepID=UPI00124231BB|nr:WHG domain-containing protein [Pandoraea iniqua]VVE44116.1 TetR family transcriptional regulator [Pandoraea iniqua]